jgi:negative regulator of flagellin synthesis FlgM
MRIDLNQLSLGNIGREVNGKKTAGKASGPAAPEDKATFSSDSLDLPTLEAQALALPEVRQDKVDALRQAIQNGDYKVDPEKIAQAIIRHNKP